MLMTILKTPRLDSLAQPKYTPEVCSERTQEKFSAGKLAARKKKGKTLIVTQMEMEMEWDMDNRLSN